MKRLATIVLLLTTLTVYSAETTLPWAEFLHRQMQQMITTDQLPNAALAVVKDGEVVFLQGYGFRHLESQEPVDAHTLLRTGSVAKVFTWTAVMQLVEQGKLDLHADIQQYLDFQLPDFPRRYRNTHPTQSISLQHLMTHTAGFEDVLEGLFSFDPQPALRDYLTQHIPARIFPPGEVMAYSNYGTALAGYIVERVSGLPFEDYVEQHIFTPLGMNHSTFRQPLPQTLHGKAVTAYRMTDDEFLPAKFEHMPAPAGGLSTSAHDMARYMLALLGQDIVASLLQPETLQLMLSPAMSYHPLLGAMCLGFKQFRMNGQNIISHGGSSNVFDSGLYLLPEQNLGIFMVYSGGNYTGHISILHNFLKTFFTAEPSVPLANLTAPASTPALQQLRGEYHQSRMLHTTPDKALNLMMGVMHIKPDEEGNLEVSHLGHTHRFRQVQPGIYQNLDPKPVYPFGPFEFLVAHQAPDGRLMLVKDGPLTYIRMPWFATSSFAALLLLPMVVLAIVSLLTFAVRGIFKAFSAPRPALPQQALLARTLLIAHALCLVMMLWLLAATGQPDPVHILPATAFGETSFLTTLLGWMPYAITLLFAGLVYFAIVQWKQKWWSTFARTHYGLYTLFAVGLVWLFVFYNLVGV